ncbi:NADP-dependent oxidoreductase domain-containing protein [Echria macrotheca]|uniref:NADP-dependent oxidoreductase domain-containing protein n=1 Tax=Echria macrotheca TaxID=438768 RepID=A0AAJ0F7M3_9PEZI|nr:NADP-dependent oxidoreductase domain-containing protein [Echria macrotheca]
MEALEGQHAEDQHAEGQHTEGQHSPRIPDTSLKLRSGFQMPQWAFVIPGACTLSDMMVHVRRAFDMGYRHFHHVPYETDDIQDLTKGAAALRSLVEVGGCQRDELFISSEVTKLGGFRNAGYALVRAEVEAIVHEYGESIGYVDLMVLSYPNNEPAFERKAEWRALMEMVEAGKVRSIGVSDYDIGLLRELNTHDRQVARLRRENPSVGGAVLSVVRWNIQQWNAGKEIAAWCAPRGIRVEIYGLLPHGPVTCQHTCQHPLKVLATSYNTSQAQILLRWMIQKKYIPLPDHPYTPGALVDAVHYEKNARVCQFELTQDEVARVSEVEFWPVHWARLGIPHHFKSNRKLAKATNSGGR